MSRPDRVFFEGAVYHVYNRLARGESVLGEEAVALRFRDLLREVVRRDDLTVFAWCLMSNHYHMAVRTSTVPLDRPLRSLQWRITRSVNASRHVFGPLWQGRYRAKLVSDQRYLNQLLAYIHLNPVSAGIVGDPAKYRWSGHTEIIRRPRNPIVDVDEVLCLFGTTRRSARAAYVRTLRAAAEEPWIGEDPGRLPWWRLGRPPKGEEEDPEVAVRKRREQERDREVDRPALSVDEYIQRGAAAAGVTVDDLRSRLRGPDVVRAREMLTVLGVERYGLRVNALAREMRKSPDSMTKMIGRIVRRRRTDPHLRSKLDDLDQAIASNRRGKQLHNGGMA